MMSRPALSQSGPRGSSKIGEASRMVHEAPRNLEPFRDFRRERFHPERFRRVVAAIKNVNAQFLGQSVGPVRPFAGDKCIHTFARRHLQLAAGAAGHDTNTTANPVATRNECHLAAHGF